VQGEIAAIDSGVSAGAMVVVDGADRLREGAKVELVVRDTPAAPASAAAPPGPPRRRP
jgi:multidrug efflux system membrane fusion protein